MWQRARSSYLGHLSRRLPFSPQINHRQGWADAQWGDKDVPAGISLAQSAKQLQGKSCVWTADGCHAWKVSCKGRFELVVK